MRLSIKLLSSDSTLNNLAPVKTVDIRHGETVDIFFQLIQENGQRYIPDAGAIVTLLIARSSTIISLNYNERQTVNDSIEREAEAVFPSDKSVYKVPLTSGETSKMASGAIKVTVVEGDKIKICQLNQAIRIIDGQEK